MTILTKKITPKTVKLLILYLCFLALLELLAYQKGGLFSVVASRLWLTTALFCSLLLLITTIHTFITDIRNRRIFLPLAYFLLLALFCVKIGTLGYSDISYEATLQIAAGLDSFRTPDLNYTGVAFMDYANRQYVLNALPALLFGRSVFTLHLGFAYPFLMGMTLLYLEWRAWLKHLGLPEEYALLPLYALPVFPFITEYFMNFEQTLTPVAFTMLGLALLLRFYRKRDIAGVLSLSFVGGMCCNAYTPVLAFFGFLLVFLGLWCSRKLMRPDYRGLLWQTALCITVLFHLCCYFAATLVTRQKDMITTAKPELSIGKSAISSWLDFFFDTKAMFWGIWLPLLIVYIVLSLIRKLRFHDLLVTVWMFLTVFFSGYLTGYTTYDKAHEIQRNMLIIPVFVTAFFFAAARYFKRHPIRLPRFVLPLCLAVLLLLGQFNFCREHHSFTYYRHVQSMKYMLACTEELLEEKNMDNTDEFRLVLLTDNSLLANLSDYTAFFYPNAHTYVMKPDEFSSDFMTDTATPLPVFVLCETPEPLQAPDTTETILTNRSFSNRRYHTTITWYCKIYNPKTN